MCASQAITFLNSFYCCCSWFCVCDYLMGVYVCTYVLHDACVFICMFICMYKHGEVSEQSWVSVFAFYLVLDRVFFWFPPAVQQTNWSIGFWVSSLSTSVYPRRFWGSRSWHLSSTWALGFRTQVFMLMQQELSPGELFPQHFFRSPGEKV